MKSGFYLRKAADGAESWLAVNVGDREMSALNGAGAADPEVGKEVSLVATARFASWWETARVWPPWVYLALVGFVVCALEWWGFHRRRTE